MMKTITVTVNGTKKSFLVEAGKSLLEHLREDWELTGSKEGCSVGECGACTVIVDGETVDSCIYLAVWVDGREVTTVEGFSGKDGSLSDVQEAFIGNGAVQCGYCTPGLVVSATALLEKNGKPTEAEIRRGLSGNLCRCTGYAKIVKAVEMSAEKRIKNRSERG